MRRSLSAVPQESLPDAAVRGEQRNGPPEAGFNDVVESVQLYNRHIATV
jgi:hypothetical protein